MIAAVVNTTHNNNNQNQMQTGKARWMSTATSFRFRIADALTYENKLEHIHAYTYIYHHHHHITNNRRSVFSVAPSPSLVLQMGKDIYTVLYRHDISHQTHITQYLLDDMALLWIYAAVGTR